MVRVRDGLKMIERDRLKTVPYSEERRRRTISISC